MVKIPTQFTVPKRFQLNAESGYKFFKNSLVKLTFAQKSL